MRTVFSYPGNMLHAQHIALALAEAECLAAFVTTFAYRTDGLLASAVGAMPAGLRDRVDSKLKRRAMPEVPGDLIHVYPVWEILRTAIQKLGANPPAVDRIWDLGSRRFDALVARRYVPEVTAIQAFEYTAQASFQRAAQTGCARILHLPSLDNTDYLAIQRRERAMWEELKSPYDAYFERKFPERQDRRAAEIAMADLLICNSSLTARSHIAAGADPARVIVVPLGAPPPISAVRVSGDARNRPLRVISAGPFSLRKGAHYLLEGWRRLNAGPHAVLDVYGKLELPERIISGGLQNINFHGSVPQRELFEAFEQADILVFPTLSDGFGLVVTEALARGLPVITTDQAGAADLINRENGMVIPTADPRAIAEALQWCLDNREKLQAMRGPALETARNQQWPHFRREFIQAVGMGLRARGYAPLFHEPPVIDANSGKESAC